jgi:hypothetical protein
MELVGLSEMTDMLAVRRHHADQLTNRPPFPAPVADLGAGRVWRRDDLAEWARATGREIVEGE